MNDASPRMMQSQPEDLRPGLMGSHISSLVSRSTPQHPSLLLGRCSEYLALIFPAVTVTQKMLQSLDQGKEHGMLEWQGSGQGLEQGWDLGEEGR